MKYIFLLISLFTFNFLQAQVTGVVKDAAGEPIPGANVFWMNTTNGVTTNEDGNFSIHKPARSHMLVVSFIGFEKFYEIYGIWHSHWCNMLALSRSGHNNNGQ